MATIPQAGKDRDWVACLRRVMSSAWWGHDVSGIDQAPVCLNGESLLGVNAAGTGTVQLIGVDSTDSVVISGSVITPSYKTVLFRTGSVGTGTARQFWISDGSYIVTGVHELHTIAETTAPTMVANINKIGAGVGTPVNGATINLKSTANTLQSPILNTAAGATSIAQGDRLQWTTSASGTELAGVTINILLTPGGRNNQISYYFSNALAIDNVFFLATRPMTVTRIDYTHSIAASGACSVMVKVDTGTQAPGAGTAMLSASFDCAAAANVVQTSTLVAANTRLNPNDRLSADFTGTTTGLTGGVITVTFAASDNRKEMVFHAQTNSTHVDAAFFIADRAYEVELASAIWSTPAGATGNAQLVVNSGTQAPATGLTLLSNDGNLGFQTDGTANTVEIGAFQSPGRNFLQRGDRLSMDFTTITSLVGFVCTVTLRPA